MDYGIYIAEIVATPALDDNRAIVRVLPYMKDAKDAECPRWSSFYRERVFAGKVGDLVWVVCDNEFSNGFILGAANYSCMPADTFEKYSITEDLWESLSETLVDTSAKGLNFTNLQVTYWNKHCVHFIERDGGGSIIAYDNGSMFIMRKDEFLVKIGRNMLRINKDSISLSTGEDESGGTVAIQSPDIRLGLSPSKNALGTMGTQADIAETSEYVWV